MQGRLNNCTSPIGVIPSGGRHVVVEEESRDPGPETATQSIREIARMQGLCNLVRQAGTSLTGKIRQFRGNLQSDPVRWH